MDWLTISAYASLVIIGAVGTLLVFHKKYEDGIVGRAALIVIMFGAGMILAQSNHWSAPIDLALAIFIHGVALFGARHAYRFLRALKDPRYRWGGGDEQMRAFK